MLAAALAFAISLAPQDTLADRITELLGAPELSRGFAGVFVKELEGPAVYSLNADKRFMPASTMKLVTGALVIEKLDLTSTLKTRAWRSGSAVYILGGADPGLTIDELLFAKAQLDLRGDERVFFDDSVLGPDRRAYGWENGDMATEDAPPISGLTVNRGSLQVWSSGGNLSLRPRNFGLTISREKSPGELYVGRDGYRVIVGGDLDESEEKKVGSVSLPDPALSAASLLGRPAERRAKLAPPAGAKVVSIEQRTIGQLLRFALVESDNQTAETLLRLCGARAGRSGSWRDSLALAEKMLLGMAVSADAFRLADGSGLSRFNELSPRSLVTLLEWTLRKHGDKFLSLMARPGEGTLKNRLAGINVRAKTGTLTGVSCLAGIVETSGSNVDGEQEWKLRVDPGIVPPKRYVFAIMFNHYAGKAERPREVQDAIVRALAGASG